MPPASPLLLGILALALGVRLVYLFEIRHVGFFTEPVSDGLVYDQRARGIAAGDWLGPADFVHAPLYAYVLGAIKICGGDNPWAPRVVQAVAGACACLLVYLIARRLFDHRVATLAALLLAVYPPAIFFDGLLQKTSVTLLLCALLIWLLVLASTRPRWWLWAVSGVVLGLLILNRQNALVFVPLVLAWLWLSPAPAAGRGRLAWGSALLLALALTLLPWAWRNRVVTGEWVLTTPNLGQNFAMGNHANATGTYLPQKRGRASAAHEQEEWTRAAEKALGRPLTAREVSDYYFNAARQWIRDNPGPWLGLTLKKCLMTWTAYETPDTEDYYLFQEHAPLLRALDSVIHFGVLAPLAIAGVVLTWPRWRQLWPLYAWLLLTTASVAAFVVFARYRVPLVPVLVPFAAAGLVELIHRLRARDFPPAAAAFAALVMAAIAFNYPVYLHRRPYAASYVNHAVALADLGRYDEAAAELDQALARSPGDVAALLVQGSVLLDRARYEAAWNSYDQVRRADPTCAAAYRGCGDALGGMGRLAEAVEAYRAALARDPDDPPALNGVAAAYARQGQLDEARSLLERALQLWPHYPEACLNLGNVHLAAGRLDEARSAYERALRERPGYADAWLNLGVVEMNAGQVPQAIAAFENVLVAAPGWTDAQRYLVMALVAARDFDRAESTLARFLAQSPGRSDLVELRRAIDAARKGK